MDQLKPIKQCKPATNLLMHWHELLINSIFIYIVHVHALPKSFWKDFGKEMNFTLKKDVAQVNALSRVSSLFTLGAEDTY